MGYIFDALNGSDDKGADNKGAAYPDGPPTAGDHTEDSSIHSYRMTDHTQRVQIRTAPIDDRIVAASMPSSIMSEEYRAIRTGILARWQHRRHLVHTITSATPQEGKTISSLNLGISFAELRNRRALLIEADLRLPRFRTMMKLPESPGLVGLLENHAGLDQAIQKIDSTGLDVISAGGRASNQTIQLLSSGRMSALIKEVRQRYDHVIIDTPPVVEFADAGIIGAMSDDVLLIVRMNHTPQPIVEHAIRALNSYNAPVAGLIATDQARSQRRYYYRYEHQQKPGQANYTLETHRAEAA